MPGQLAQVLFYLIALGTLILAVRAGWRFFGRPFPGEAWWLLSVLVLPRLLLIVAMPLNGNERGGDGLTYWSVARDFPDSHLVLSPGYSYLLGLGLRLLPPLELVAGYVVVVGQHALGVLTGLLLFWCLRPDSRVMAWAAALGWGLLSTTLFSEHVTRPEFLAAFLLYAAVCLVTAYRRVGVPGGNPWLLWAGYALGWGVLARVNMLPVLLAFIAYLIARRGVTTSWWAPSVRFAAPAVLVVAAYVALNHYPSTRSWILNWTLTQGNIQATVSPERLQPDRNPHVREILRIHRDVAAHLRVLEGEGRDLRELVPFPQDPFRRLTSPELEQERAAFQAFRERLPPEYTPGSARFEEESRRLYGGVPGDLSGYLMDAAPYYFVGLPSLHRLWLGAALLAIRADPVDYLLGIARRVGRIFFLHAEREYSVSRFAMPPLREELSIFRVLPGGSLWAERHAVGLFWPALLAGFRLYARVCEVVVSGLALLFPLALVGLLLSRRSSGTGVASGAWLALLVLVMYCGTGLAVSGAGEGRVFLPVYPLLFHVAAAGLIGFGQAVAEPLLAAIRSGSRWRRASRRGQRTSGVLAGASESMEETAI